MMCMLAKGLTGTQLKAFASYEITADMQDGRARPCGGVVDNVVCSYRSLGHKTRHGTLHHTHTRQSHKWATLNFMYKQPRYTQSENTCIQTELRFSSQLVSEATEMRESLS